MIDKPRHKIKNIKFIDDRFSVVIDGNNYSFDIKSISNKLLNATQSVRNNYRISPSGYGINWPLLDEDISIDGLIKFSQIRTISKKRKIIS